MTPRSRALPWLTVPLSMLLLSSATVAAAADDPCTGAKWDVSQEHALFLKAPEAVPAGHDLASAPVMKAQKMYGLTLTPQSGVTFVLPPSKKMLPDGAFAGLGHMQVPAGWS